MNNTLFETPAKTGELRLLSLRLRNFRGLAAFELRPEGANIDVYGDNGVGKTTIADALAWLLFGKDSNNRADFEIKTLDGNGEALHHLEHEVEGAFEINGKTITFRRCFKEKYTVRRGSSESEFAGHTTDFWVNDVPTAANVYSLKVSEVCEETRFRLLTDPLFFNLQMKWQDRRRLLLEVCGDVSDESVIASRSDLEPLRTELQGRTIEEVKAIATERRKKINEELKVLPARIDEAKRSIPEITGNLLEIEAEIETLTKNRNEIQSEIARIQNGGEVAEKRKQLAEIDTKIITLKNEAANASAAVQREKQGRIQKASDAVRAAKSALDSEVQARDGLNVRRNREEETRLGYVAQFNQTRDLVFTPPTLPSTCATCGQSLPESEIAENLRKAEEEFNSQRATTLEGIREKGKAAKAAVEEVDAQIAKSSERITELEQNVAAAEKVLSEVQVAANTESPASVQESPEMASLQAERLRVESELTSLTEGDNTILDEKQQQVRALDSKINALSTEKAKFSQKASAEARVKELLAQEKTLSQTYGEHSKIVDLVEQFIRAKVALLTDRINSKFSYVSFKLFETQINGGITECCEATWDGVPYSDLNSAKKVNAGLDVIRTLQNHFGFHPPVVIDGAESITSFLPMDCQLIKLVVSESDKTLRVEVR